MSHILYLKFQVSLAASISETTNPLTFNFTAEISGLIYCVVNVGKREFCDYSMMSLIFAIRGL